MRTIFLTAAFLTAFVFLMGILIGVWLDTGRLSEIRGLLTENELLGTDIDMQSRLLQLTRPDAVTCNAAMRANLDYNDRIYADGRKIEQAEIANRFTPELLLERKRYALQQLAFWTNSLDLKGRCGADYVTVLELWAWDTSSKPELVVPQRLQSAALLDAKERCGEGMMLSNVPVDLGLISVDMLVSSYNVTRLPAVIINGEVIEGGDALERIKAIRC